MPSPHPTAPDLSYCDAFGILWSRGSVWLAAGSPLNRQPHVARPLIDTYEDPFPLPPTPEDLEIILDELGLRLPVADALGFQVESALLRAAARCYYAP